MVMAFHRSTARPKRSRNHKVPQGSLVASNQRRPTSWISCLLLPITYPSSRLLWAQTASVWQDRCRISLVAADPTVRRLLFRWYSANVLTHVQSQQGFLSFQKGYVAIPAGRSSSPLSVPKVTATISVSESSCVPTEVISTASSHKLTSNWDVALTLAPATCSASFNKAL